MRHFLLRLLAVTAIVTLATACTAQAVPPATAPATATSELATPVPPTATSVQATETLVPPTAEPPTAEPPTPVPPTAEAPTPTTASTATPNSAAGPIRLTLPSGGTDMDLQGQLQPKETRTYVVSAAKGQPMIVDLSSPDDAAHLAIRGQDGTLLLSAAAATTTWQGLLPATQDYLLQVIAPAAVTNFDLSLEIGSRLAFAPGAITTIVKGTAQAGLITTYVLLAMAGQTLTATLQSADNSVVLSMYGFQDGNPMVRSAEDATTFTTKLPSTQDYIVKAVQTAAMPVDFVLTITVK